MTPKPPSPSEGSPHPPRSRSNPGDFVRDSAESDLWAFDDLDLTDDGAPRPPSPPISQTLPEPRGLRKKKGIELTPSKPAAPQSGVQATPAKETPTPPKPVVSTQPRPGADFDELEDLAQWDERAEPVLSIHPSLITPPAGEGDAVEELAVEAVPASDSSDELSPVAPANAKPVSLVPHLGLSRLERFGLGLLCVILLIGGTVVFFNTIHRLPTDSERLKAEDFPVKGRHVTILSAETFWRAPITEGSNPEMTRRGTQLLPVIQLTSSGGPAMIRVFFRDPNGLVMGDAVTRTLKPGVPLQVAATAGFDDIGMHAAYRTGQTKPWTIEVLEAPAGAASNADFKKIFDINISTDRR